MSPSEHALPATNADPIGPPIRADVLLVEDHPPTAAAMTQLMEKVGVFVTNVTTVKDGKRALSLLPAVIVIDLLLPDGNGVELLEEIRSLKLWCKVAIVSVATDAGLFERVRRSRPDAIFGKPLDFEEFVQWLCEAFPTHTGRHH